MGRGKHYSLHETDDTRASGQIALFDQILERIVAAGGDVLKDEESPLYDELGGNEAEVGTRRVAELNFNKTDFQLIQTIHERHITGAGHNKSLEELSPPRISTTLKKKTEDSQDWQTVDLEDMF
ncbi:MAG: hypothetical protein WC873_00240 [Candidatus Gracilibacteria bacterium]